MCGKFTQMMSWGQYVTLADLIGAPKSGPETVTPMRDAFVIALDGHGERKSVRMRWGLVPRGDKNPNAGPRHIHARSETIDTKITFADSFARRRGLVVVDTFNEGEEITPTKTRQYVVTPRDGKPMAIAVIWDRWGEPHGGFLLSFAMVTVPPNKLIGTITDRMPAVLQPDDWAKWLGEEPATVDELKVMLKPFDGDWTMAPQQKTGPPPRPPRQPDLF
jgi:putative SOS response-associated peptidase YedK